jgi:tryptophanase
MLTDSGTNAMSDNQVAAMFQADDAYAGSQSFERLQEAVYDVLGKKYLLPVHQGRAAENVICHAFVKPGNVVPTNYHFTTTLAHVMERGGTIEELYHDRALVLHSDHPFKGNMDIDKLEACIQKHGVEKIPFVRMEASTNLIGGQPFSIRNMMDVRAVCDKYGIMLVLDASLLGENAFLVKQREDAWKENTMGDILKTMTNLADLVYFSARKLSSSRGGGICTNRRDIYAKMEALIPLYEGFLTYGGISVREIEAMAVGLRETLDETMISQSPTFIKYMVETLDAAGIPVITPPGVLGCHINAGELGIDLLLHISNRIFHGKPLIQSSLVHIADGDDESVQILAGFNDRRDLNYLIVFVFRLASKESTDIVIGHSLGRTDAELRGEAGGNAHTVAAGVGDAGSVFADLNGIFCRVCGSEIAPGFIPVFKAALDTGQSAKACCEVYPLVRGDVVVDQIAVIGQQRIGFNLHPDIGEPRGHL